MWRKNIRRRSRKRLGLLLIAGMFLAVFGYTQNSFATIRVSAGIDYYGGDYGLLAEYGEWLDTEPYGVVWCPYVDERWAPFHDGRWIRTRGGWAWNSYEPFGGLVYHYGYWYYDHGIGWFWVPGEEWSPARVQWYTYGNYCGWAPIPPPNYYWPDPWDFYDFNIWIVVRIDNFYDDHIGRHGIDQTHYRGIFRRDFAVKRAPNFQQVEKVARRQIPVQAIAKRPMDMRVDRFKVTERSTTRQDVRARETVSENRTRVTAPVRNTGVERKVATGKQSVRSERKTVVSKKNIQPQRQAVAPKQNSQPQRKAVAPKQNTQVVRRAEGPAKSSPRAKSRTVERSSDRTDKADKARKAR